MSDKYISFALWLNKTEKYLLLGYKFQNVLPLDKFEPIKKRIQHKN